MSRQGTLGVAGIVTVAMLASTGGAVASAMVTSKQIADESIRSRDVRDGSLKTQDLHGSTVANLRGAAGPAGDPGPVGPQGPSATVETVSFYGPVPAIQPNDNQWTFAGPPAQVTTTDSHRRVVASASVALGYAAGTPTGYADLGMCYRLASGGTTLNFYGGNFTQYGFTGSRQAYSASATLVLTPGVFLVGMCVRNTSASPISNNNYVNGYAQVTS